MAYYDGSEYLRAAEGSRLAGILATTTFAPAARPIIILITALYCAIPPACWVASVGEGLCEDPVGAPMRRRQSSENPRNPSAGCVGR